MAEQIKGHMTEYSKVFSRIAVTNTRQIFPKGYIQDPMDSIFNLPVSADGLGELNVTCYGKSAVFLHNLYNCPET